MKYKYSPLKILENKNSMTIRKGDDYKMNPQQKKLYAVKQDEEDRKNMDKKWEKLNQKIKSKQADYEEPVIPFKSCNLIKDYNDLYAKIYDKEKFIQA